MTKRRGTWMATVHRKLALLPSSPLHCRSEHAQPFRTWAMAAECMRGCGEAHLAVVLQGGCVGREILSAGLFLVVVVVLLFFIPLLVLQQRQFTLQPLFELLSCACLKTVTTTVLTARSWSMQAHQYLRYNFSTKSEWSDVIVIRQALCLYRPDDHWSGLCPDARIEGEGGWGGRVVN